MNTPDSAPASGNAATRPAVTASRAASAKDYATCADIWLEASLAGHDFISPGFWREQRTAMTERYLPAAEVLLLYADGAPAAFAAVLPGGAPCLAALFVQPCWWGHGLGRRLLELVQAEFCAGDGTGLRCTVYAKNSRALAFYAHMGFTPEAHGTCPHTNEPQIELRWTAAGHVHPKAATVARS